MPVMSYELLGVLKTELFDKSRPKMEIAKARVKQQNLAWGRGEELEKGGLARETAYARRRLSFASVIAFGQRLAVRHKWGDRTLYWRWQAPAVGERGRDGQERAGGRRQQWRREAEMARREREAGASSGGERLRWPGESGRQAPAVEERG